MLRREFVFPLIAALLMIAPGWAAVQFAGRVVDENGLAVAGARLTLGAESATTDEAGRFRLPSLPAGTYELRVEKPGYYAYVNRAFELSDPPRPIEIILNHQQEFEETVNVVYSAPVIDAQETAAQKTIREKEIVDVPYPATHDIRGALPLLAGVVRDNEGRIHLNGGAENQAYFSLDGFNIANPASGAMQNRVSVDAIRAVRVETSRYSAEFGKGAAGVMALETSRGDDRHRFAATNFLPSFEFHDGPALSGWTPRITLSGPVVRGRAWFFNATDLQYDYNIIDELPPEANSNRNWHGGNLSRFQVNLSPSNLLTAGFLFNFTNSLRFGITPHDPVEASRNIYSRFYFFNIKDQLYLQRGWVIEFGLASNSLNSDERPLGNATYVISPEGRSGNYFRSSKENVGRLQALSNVLVRPLYWRGRHDLKFGLDANRIRYRQQTMRRPFEIRREGGAPARAVGFSGAVSFAKDSFEFSAYIQDRWAPGERLLIEAGIRLDWDQVLRDAQVSPRLAFSYAPRLIPESKFAAGIGIFYDATNLGLLARAMGQDRTDIFLSKDGMYVADGPVTSRYFADDKDLRGPIFVNWSLGWEQKLPGQIYFGSSFIRRHGRRGWTYDLVAGSPETGPRVIEYELRSDRRDSYYSVELNARRMFREKYSAVISYARSSARSTAVLDFSPDNPIFSRQAGGPAGWDAPNRLISWGILPAPRFERYTVAYFLEWRSGLPYSIVDEGQRLIGAPNSRRFPDYFSLNLHLERRFRFWRWEWALRAGFNNLTGRRNPVVVNNNIDSLRFGEFAGGPGRAFTGRLRFLGRK